MISAESTGRAAVAGNPGDVYLKDAFVLAYSIQNKAHVEIEDSESLILKSKEDIDPDHKLIKQTLKHFKINTPLKISYSSDIPFQSGLGGSASILVSFIACLNKRFPLNLSLLEISKHSLQIEHELGIGAGWQDRAAAVFGSSLIDCQNFKCGSLNYLPPNLFIVYYGKEISSGYIHKNNNNDLNEEFLALMSRTREIAKQAHKAINNKDLIKLGQLMNENWEIRESTLGLTKKDKFFKDLILENHGFANQTGSGGAAIVLDSNNNLKPIFESHNLKIIKPKLYGGLKLIC